jgi:hypothetical protein
MNDYLQNWLKIPYDPNDWPNKKNAPWQILKSDLEAFYPEVKCKTENRFDWLGWVDFIAGEDAAYAIKYVLQRMENDEGKFIFFGLRVEKPDQGNRDYCLEKKKKARFEEWTNAFRFLQERSGSVEYRLIDQALADGAIVCEYTTDDQDFYEVDTLQDLKQAFDESGPDERLDAYLGRYFYEKDLGAVSRDDFFRRIFEALRLICPLHDFVLSKQ